LTVAINQHFQRPIWQQQQGFRALQVIAQITMGMHQGQNGRFGHADQIQLTADGEEHGALISVVIERHADWRRSAVIAVWWCSHRWS
jgi:hypothetical protein